MSLLAGTAKVEITCREEGAAAYVVSEKTKAHIPRELWDKKIAIDDPLYLKALVLDDGSRKYVLITMDVTAVGCRSITQDILGDSADDFMPALRKLLLAETGIPEESVTVSASHTHPPGRLLCDDAEQLEKAVWAVQEALQNLQPVNVGSASAVQDSLTYNRTLMMKDGSDCTLRSCNPYPPDDEIEAMRPVDPEVGVLRVDRLDGTPLGVVYNFGCHLLIGNHTTNITADFPGVTSSHVEKVLGHGVMAFFLQGAGGDISEIAQMDREHPKWGPGFGMTLGQSVLEAHAAAMPSEVGINIVSETVQFPLRTDISEKVAALRREQAEMTASFRYTNLSFKTFLPLYLKYSLNPDFPLHSAYRYLRAKESGEAGFRTLDSRNRRAIEKYLHSLKAMEKMATNEENIETHLRHQELIDVLGGPTVAAEIQGIRIGETVLISAPMEILAETGLRLKKSSPFSHTLVASISNGYLHYAPPATYYARGGYEATECLLAPKWEAIFHAAVEKIFEQLARAR